MARDRCSGFIHSATAVAFAAVTASASATALAQQPAGQSPQTSGSTEPATQPGQAPAAPERIAGPDRAKTSSRLPPDTSGGAQPSDDLDHEQTIDKLADAGIVSGLGCYNDSNPQGSLPAELRKEFIIQPSAEVLEPYTEQERLCIAGEVSDDPKDRSYCDDPCPDVEPPPFPPVDDQQPSTTTDTEGPVEMGPQPPQQQANQESVEKAGEDILEEVSPAKVIASAPPAPLDAASATILALHNQARAQVDCPPLQWDPQLAAQAASYGPELAQYGRPVHSSRKGRETSRENLLQALRGTPVDKMVAVWTAERQHFVPGTFPNVSRTGNWADVGHYTQMVWRGTTHIGCAIYRGGQFDWLICRYSPPGNQDGKPVL